MKNEFYKSLGEEAKKVMVTSLIDDVSNCIKSAYDIDEEYDHHDRRRKVMDEVLEKLDEALEKLGTCLGYEVISFSLNKQRENKREKE